MLSRPSRISSCGSPASPASAVEPRSDSRSTSSPRAPTRPRARSRYRGREGAGPLLPRVRQPDRGRTLRGLLGCPKSHAGTRRVPVTQELRGGVGQFTATQHALRSFADTFRAELAEGIRVLNVYLGRTATERQRAIFERTRRVPGGELIRLNHAGVPTVPNPKCAAGVGLAVVSGSLPKRRTLCNSRTPSDFAPQSALIPTPRLRRFGCRAPTSSPVRAGYPRRERGSLTRLG